MCVYNTNVKYLDESIESIINQTYGKFEFVIVDDGSNSQDTLKCLDDWAQKDPRIILVKNNNNLGLTKSLNIGIRRCKGEYIARMDADDVSSADRIEKQLNYLESHEDVALVGSRIACFGDNVPDANADSDGNGLRDMNLYHVRALICHPGPAHPTFMFRASFLQENNIQYNELIKKGQDYGIIADILQHGGKIATIDEPLLQYRVHDGQITSTSEIEQLLYQSATSYKYLKAMFNNLSDEECAVLSTLGWYVEGNQILGKLENNKDIALVCEHLIKYKDSLEKPGIYISGIRKLLIENEKKNLFNQRELVAEMRSRWWKKAVRISKLYHKPWGMTIYTICSYIHVLKRRQ